MATPIIMPRQGQSVESCIITKWHKRVGDAVNVGDVIFSYETDKAAFDEESQVAGTMLAAFFEEGDDVPCLTNVCAIGDVGEDASGLAPGGVPERTEAPEKAPMPVAAIENAPAAAPKSGELLVSPRARAMCDRTGVDPRLAIPTGPNGRVIERDIQALAAQGVIAAKTGAETPAEIVPAAQAAVAAPGMETPEYTDVPLTGVRKAIARSMTASLADIPQLTHTLSFDAENMLAYRALLKDRGEAMGLSSITLGDIVMYAASRTLMNYPDLNAHYTGTGIRRFKDVHLGFAVDTPRGLLVPTVRYANRLSLLELSKAVKDLAQQAIAGNIPLDLISGASFTVSNLGAFGIEHFTPVINPPQTGILGVNTIVERVRAKKDGGLEAYRAMGLSLTYDHRAIDGAPASRFLQELQKNLESFSMLLAK